MDAEEGVITLVSKEVMKGTGVSNYDYHYRTFRCCYCDEPISLTMESSKIMTDEKIMEHYRTYKFLSPSDEDKIRNDVSDRESGNNISKNQYIHTRCLLIIQDPDNSVILQLIKDAGKIVPPTKRNANIYSIPKYTVYDNKPCVYGDGILDAWNPGMRYRMLNDLENDRFLHYRCYNKIRIDEKRLMTPTISEQRYLTPPDKLPETGLTVDILRQKSDEWYEFWSSSKQTDKEIFRFFFDTIRIAFGRGESINDDDKERDTWLTVARSLIRLPEDQNREFQTDPEKRLSEMERLDKILESYPGPSPEEERRIIYKYNIIHFFNILTEMDKK